MLQNARDRESSAATGNKYMDQAVFFDYLTWFMVCFYFMIYESDYDRFVILQV